MNETTGTCAVEVTQTGESNWNRLLEERLLSYQALAQNLAGGSDAYVTRDPDGIMEFVHRQLSCSAAIARAEEMVDRYSKLHPSPPNESRQAPRSGDLLRRTVSIKRSLHETIRTHSMIVREAIRNNFILQNLHASSHEYADPRSSSRQKVGQ
jgi:hypothetical protein